MAYDPNADNWSQFTTLPPLPAGQESNIIFEHTIVSYNGKLVSLSGDVDGRAIIVVDPMTGQANRYENALAEDRSDYVAGVINGSIYLVGGIRPGTTFTQVPTIEVKTK
jgi:hypothetical protein